jgi:hypothetical protein
MWKTKKTRVAENNRLIRVFSSADRSGFRFMRRSTASSVAPIRICGDDLVSFRILAFVLEHRHAMMTVDDFDGMNHLNKLRMVEIPHNSPRGRHDRISRRAKRLAMRHHEILLCFDLDSLYGPFPGGACLFAYRPTIFCANFPWLIPIPVPLSGCAF